jgi:hypothetical protein
MHREPHFVRVILTNAPCITSGLRLNDAARNGSEVCVVDTLVNLFTIIVVNTTAKMLIHFVTKQSSFEVFSALFIMTITLQCAVTFYKRIS